MPLPLPPFPSKGNAVVPVALGGYNPQVGNYCLSGPVFFGVAFPLETLASLVISKNCSLLLTFFLVLVIENLNFHFIFKLLDSVGQNTFLSFSAKEARCLLLLLASIMIELKRFCRKH